jgi:CRP-like cAMP-binding protein
MKSILLIEDNVEMRENIAEILELSDYLVVTAKNGKEGVQVAKEKAATLDLIICDIMMPELDGFGVLNILNRFPATASLPFIFLTAKAEKEDFRIGMNLGADDYLTKPFDDTALLDTIDRRLKKAELYRNQQPASTDQFDGFIDLARGEMQLKNLSKNRNAITFNKKETIFREGDSPSNLYYISEGKVKLVKMNDDGKEYITGLFKEGECFGFIPLLEDISYTETAQAIEKTTVQLIPKKDFLSLLNSNRDVAARFIKLLSNNIVEKEEKLLQLAYDSVRKRVAEGLLLYHGNYFSTEGTSGPFPVSREDLAKTVGTSTESVIRTLHDFKEEQLIEVAGRHITIKNQTQLANLRF